MASIMTIRLNKNPGSSWGFRLQGGKDFATPLCIQKVNVGSVAEQAGLQAGDAIVSINNSDALAMRHKEAQDAIVKAGNNFELVVQRGSQIWKPAVTALPETKILSDGVPVATKTSLAANQKLVNAQYNSPVNIYSEDSIAETLSAQAEVLGKGVLGINFKKYAREEKIRTDSPTYKLLHGEEEEERKPRPVSMHNVPDSIPFQKDVIQDHKGYYSINDKLYCDIHAKQAARSNPPAPNLVPVTVQPGAAPPPGVLTAPQASKMKIPSAFQQGGPAFAPAPAPAPAPFKPPSGGIKLLPVSSSAIIGPTPFKRAPAPAPAPVKPFAPAPAPAPVAAPVKPASAPSYSTSANPQGFGAPAGDINVRAHIPKKGSVTEVSALQTEIPICNSCNEKIRGPFVSALGKTWCPDHFICATTTCKRNIIDMGFVEEKGLLYCENCYESFLAPICGKCDKRIKGDCLNAVGKQFHPECFCCAYCGKVFGSGAFYLEDGLPYCETDWNDLFTTKCVGCNFPIEAGDRWVEALNNNYHSQCFKCSKCNKNLEGQSFFAKGGKPFCKAHAQRGLI